MSVLDAMLPESYARYWAKVDKVDGGCWLWTAAVGSHGYGVLGVRHKALLATHIALELAGAPRPAAPNNHALHGDCSNRRCVNPSHLRWGANRENIGDKMRLNRQAVGVSLPQTRLTDEAVREIRRSADRQSVLAARFGVSQGQISRAKTGRTHAHVR